MRTETREIKIYEFNELKKDIQEKVKERIKEHLIDSNFEFLEETLEEILSSDYKIKDFKIDYSLSYCQGDGVCFYNRNKNLLSYSIIKNKDIENANAFEKYCIENLDNKEYQLLLEFLNSDYDFKLVKSYNNYSHAYTCTMYYEYYYNDNKNQEEKVNNFIDKLSEILFDKVYIVICNILEETGYNCYNVSEEEILDFIDSNDYEFLGNGDLY